MHTHTLPDGVGIVFAVLASQTACLLGYYWGGEVVIVVIAVASNRVAEPGGW